MTMFPFCIPQNSREGNRNNPGDCKNNVKLFKCQLFIQLGERNSFSNEYKYLYKGGILEKQELDSSPEKDMTESSDCSFLKTVKRR